MSSFHQPLPIFLLILTFLLPVTNSLPSSQQPLLDTFSSIDDFKEKMDNFFDFLQSNLNSTSLDTLDNITRLLPSNNASSHCIEAIKTIYEELKDRSEISWILEMIDSFGRPSSGLMQGKFQWPGSYTQCKSVVQSKKKDGVPLIRGQFCWVDITVDATSIPFLKKFNIPTVDIQNGVCIPNLCSSNELELVLNFLEITELFQHYIIKVTANCISEERGFWKDTGAIVSLTFCIIMALLIFAGTTYDLFQRVHLKAEDFRLQFRLKTTSLSISADGDKTQIIDDSDENGAGPSNQVENPANAEGNQQENKKRSLLDKIMLSFSLYTNGSKLMKMTSGQDTLTSLNGIRVFSMLWIILGHSYLNADVVVKNNLLETVNWMSSLNFYAVVSGMFAVDSFFVLSGLLLTYLFLRDHEKKGKVSWIKFYVHRYLRITPLYAIVLFVFESGFGKYYANGPLWPENGTGGDYCPKNWWWNLLYINNFLPNAKMCMGHTWYLANDMQFYIISPLVLILLTKSVFLAMAVCGGFILTSLITTGVLITVNNEYHPDNWLGDFQPMFDLVYDKPYCRVGAYAIGMICGYALYKTKCQLKLNKLLVILGWILAIGLSSVVVFSPYQTTFTIHTYSLYQSVSHIAWSVAVAWMAFACCNGYGGIMNDILSWPLWQPLGRLTYATYLIHPIIIKILIASLDIVLPFSYTINVMIWLSSSVISYFLAMFFSLCFEAPFLALEKIAL